MLSIQARSGAIRFREEWFHPAPSFRRSLGLVHFIQSPEKRHIPGLIRHSFTTIIVDLSASEGRLLASCNASTRNQIRRAGRERITTRVESDHTVLMRVYNSFAANKSLDLIDDRYLHALGDSLRITSAWLDQRPLVVHAYVVDEAIGRARSLYSASPFREAGTPQALFGYANRFLHYQDMLYFKSADIRYFDLGGYAPRHPSPDFRRIAEFKEGFGGEVVEEYNYASLCLQALRRGKDALKRRS